MFRAHRCPRQWPLIGLAVGGPDGAPTLLETSPLDTVLSCCEKDQRKGEKAEKRLSLIGPEWCAIIHRIQTLIAFITSLH